MSEFPALKDDGKSSGYSEYHENDNDNAIKKMTHEK